jgi:hypothetical protein
VTVEVPDPAASACWLADVFGLEGLPIGQDAARVPLPGCAITFARGAADRITKPLCVKWFGSVSRCALTCWWAGS